MQESALKISGDGLFEKLQKSSIATENKLLEAI